MGTCLVTALKESVTDDSLLKLGEFTFHVMSHSGVGRIEGGGGLTLRIIGDGYFTSQDGTANYGKGPRTDNAFWLSPGEYDIVVMNKYTISWLRFNGQREIELKLDDLEYMPLQSIEATYGGQYGSIDKLPKSLSYLVITRLHWSHHPMPITGNLNHFENYPTPIDILSMEWCENIEGDISSLSGLTSLTYLNFSVNPKITGNIGSLSSLTNLETLVLHSNPLISGNIGSLSGITSLKTINLVGTSVSGSLGSINTLSNLETLVIDGTNVSGNTSSLRNLTNLKTFSYANCPNITGTWPLT